MGIWFFLKSAHSVEDSDTISRFAMRLRLVQSDTLHLPYENKETSVDEWMDLIKSHTEQSSYLLLQETCLVEGVNSGEAKK